MSSVQVSGSVARGPAVAARNQIQHLVVGLQVGVQGLEQGVHYGASCLHNVMIIVCSKMFLRVCWILNRN